MFQHSFLQMFLLYWQFILLRLVSSTITSVCFGELSLELPVRYLHVQLVNNGQNATRSMGEVMAKVETECRTGSRVIDRGDGSYIFQLELRTSCPRIEIELSLEGQRLCNSPIIIEKKDRLLLPERCHCPIPVDDWMKQAECSREPQLESDLSQWESISFARVLNASRQLWGQPAQSRTYSVCHYQIIEQKVYRDCFGEYDGFKAFLDDILLSVLNKIQIENTEFIFNLGDYPLSHGNDIPVVSWCGSKRTQDIVVPTYQLTNTVIGSLGSDGIHSTGLPYVPWEDKLDKAIFRGRDSNALRLELARLSERDPELVDAGITNYFFYNKETERTPRKESIKFSEFFKYKYVVSIDGTVAAYRLPMLLPGNSVLLKSDSEYYEHFYAGLEPFSHYIPFNGTNMEERLKWARTQDHSRRLSNTRQFVLDHLQPINIYCYFAQFLKTYSALLEERPTSPADGMEQADGARRSRECDCDRETPKTEL